MRQIGCAWNADSRWTMQTVVLLLALAVLGVTGAIDDKMEGTNVLHSEVIKEGGSCMLESGKDGVWQRNGSCSWMVDRNHQKNVQTAFDEVVPFVCCPKISLGVKFAIKVCASVKGVHQITDHIWFGEPVELPFVAALGYKVKNPESNENIYEWHCSSNLITPSFLLTAAHCLSDNNRTYVARMGSPNLFTAGKNALSEIQERSLKNILKHPVYRSKEMENDIAVAKVDMPFELNENVGLVCLPTSLEDKDEIMNLNVAGWGRTEKRKSSETLLRTNVTTVPIRKCRKEYELLNKRLLRPQVIRDTNYCAIGGASNGIDIGDACERDSGGPLYTISNISGILKYQLIGIISYGVNCGSPWPGVYVRVSSYLDWIASYLCKDYQDRTFCT